jgi:hypothetical protein
LTIKGTRKAEDNYWYIASSAHETENLKHSLSCDSLGQPSAKLAALLLLCKGKVVLSSKSKGNITLKHYIISCYNAIANAIPNAFQT